MDRATDLRRETVFALEEMGIRVEYSHHEVAPSQHEIDLRYNDALVDGRQGDDLPADGQGDRPTERRLRHLHAQAGLRPERERDARPSVALQGRTRTPSSTRRTSTTSRRRRKHYIAGILVHAPEITAISNQWVNSYKRLVPGYEAPVYISWARRNRSAMVRVPMYKPGKEKATRIEFRSPDPACNPYLAFAVMLAAGMRGVEKAYPLPDPVEEDIFEMDEKAREKAGITSLPGSLYEAMCTVREQARARHLWGTTSSTSSSRTRRWNGTVPGPREPVRDRPLPADAVGDRPRTTEAEGVVSDFPLRKGTFLITPFRFLYPEAGRRDAPLPEGCQGRRKGKTEGCHSSGKAFSRERMRNGDAG